MFLRTGVVGATVAILLTSLLSCSSTTASKQSEPTIPASQIKAITDPSQVQRPIDAYLLNANELTAFSRAYTKAMVDCALGTNAASVQDKQDYRKLANMRVRDRAVRSSLWGYFEPGMVKTYGYEALPNNRITQPLPYSASQEIVAKCENELLPRTGVTNEFPDDKSLPDRGPTTATSDSRFVKAVNAWRDCMAKSGYKYNNPWDALSAGINEYAQSSGPTEPVGGHEIALATADINCKISTNLVGIAVAIQSAYDQLYINQHITQLTDYRAKLESFIRAS